MQYIKSNKMNEIMFVQKRVFMFVQQKVLKYIYFHHWKSDYIWKHEICIANLSP